MSAVSSPAAGPIFTIGHSNRSLDAFVALLRGARVDMIADIRSFPRSRTNPQFNIDTLPQALQAHQIGYGHWPDLGGRRSLQHTVDDETNGMWHNRSFHNYADYALTAPFHQALDRLVALSAHHRLAMMCSEAVWWRCHRRIVTDYLLARGIAVLHIMDIGKTTPAKLTPGAVIRDSTHVQYPEATGEPEPERNA